MERIGLVKSHEGFCIKLTSFPDKISWSGKMIWNMLTASNMLTDPRNLSLHCCKGNRRLLPCSVIEVLAPNSIKWIRFRELLEVLSAFCFSKAVWGVLRIGNPVPLRSKWKILFQKLLILYGGTGTRYEGGNLYGHNLEKIEGRIPDISWLTKIYKHKQN